jgi:hypothetical protein
MDREELIDRLITTGHLNVPDRKSLAHLGRNEVFAAVRVRLERDGFFPPNAGIEGWVYEGPFIRRSENRRYVGINQRSRACDPRVVAETAQRSFDDIEAAVNWYIDAEWGSSIDGIPFT